MEYKKDVRTKNLTLRDIFVGDWVQVWSEITKRYSPPLKIIQICDDGTIYLVTSDEEKCTPWEENIKDVDALPITPELLKGFGFELEVNKVSTKVNYKQQFISYLVKLSGGKYRVGLAFRYLHDLCYYISTSYGLTLEWKGLDKTK